MKISLQKRTSEHVKIFWTKTQDQEIQAMFPASISSLEEALRLFEASQEDHASSFGRIILDDKTYIGDIWVYGIDEELEKTAMLSLVVFDKARWGKGIASAVIPLFIKEVFKRFEIKTIGAFTYASNRRSRGALKNAGFQEMETFLEDGIESVYLECKRKDKEKE